MIEFEVGYVHQVIDENYNKNKLLGQVNQWRNLLVESCWFSNAIMWISTKSNGFFSIVGEAWNHILSIEF
jgi:hypothetical protein